MLWVTLTILFIHLFSIRYNTILVSFNGVSQSFVPIHFQHINHDDTPKKKKKKKIKQNMKEKKQKVMVQLGSTQPAVLDQGGTDPLSFHCQEREVVAAL
jgi:hypothetical protein